MVLLFFIVYIYVHLPLLSAGLFYEFQRRSALLFFAY